MFKHFSKLLVFSLGLLLLVPTGVSASTISSWADYHFEDKQKPPQGTQLYFKDNPPFDIDSYKVWDIPDGSYKVLSYYNGTLYGVGWKTFTEDGETFKDKVLKPYTKVEDLSKILEETPVSSQTEGTFLTCTNADGYALFFKDTAKSVDDLLFVCKIADIPKYNEDGVSEANYTTDTKHSSTAKHKITLVQKLNDSGTEAKFKLDFNLGKVTLNGETITESGSVLMVDDENVLEIADKDRGTLEFTLSDLRNKTYKYYISSLNGFKYSGTFKVDFVTSDNSSGSFEDELAEEKAFDKIPDREPKIKITGFPKKSTQRGIPVTLTLTSDIACTVNFNGKSLNDEKAKKVKFDVSENGSYSYTVNTGKRVVNKVLEINFFDDTMPVADAVNAKLDTTGINSETSDIKLAQTGIEPNRTLFLLVILAGSGVLMALVFITRKKGAKTDEEN